MNERSWASSESTAAIPTGVDGVRVELQGYKDRGVTEMIGPTLVNLADAYERRAAQTEENTDDLAQEIACRVEAARYLATDDAKMMEAWSQRRHALTDLLDEDGQPKFSLAHHPDLAKLSVEQISQLMLEFERWALDAKTLFNARRYNDVQLDDIYRANRRLGIGSIR